MKTSYFASKTGILLPLIKAVIFVLLTLGCEEADYIIRTRVLIIDTHESDSTASYWDTTFVVYPSGTHIIALDGQVELGFFEGAVFLPTEFIIKSIPTDGMEGYGINMQKWGMVLESHSDERKFYNKVRLWMTYDQFPIGTEVVMKEDNLTIYRNDWQDTDDTGFESIGNCVKDFSKPRIRGIINDCGFYVVGEK